MERHEGVKSCVNTYRGKVKVEYKNEIMEVWVHIHFYKGEITKLEIEGPEGIKETAWLERVELVR